jgi:hypothetical protein
VTPIAETGPTTVQCTFAVAFIEQSNPKPREEPGNAKYVPSTPKCGHGSPMITVHCSLITLHRPMPFPPIPAIPLANPFFSF